MKLVKKLTAVFLVAALAAALSGCLFISDFSETETIRVPGLAEQTGSYQSKLNEIVAYLDEYYVDGL